MMRIYLFFRGLYSYLKYIIFGEEKARFKMIYAELLYISFFSKKQYIELKNSIIRGNLNKIRQKSACKVGFVVYTSSMWSLEGLYHIFEKNPSYLPSVIVAPLVDTSRTTFDETQKFFLLFNQKYHELLNYLYLIKMFQALFALQIIQIISQILI